MTSDSSPTVSPAGAPRTSSIGAQAVAAGVLSFGVFFLIGASAIEIPSSYALIGPRFFPYMVGSGLIVCGLLLGWRQINPYRRRQPALANTAEEWQAVYWIVAGLILNVALIENGGFIVSSTLLFIVAARGLGSRNYLTSMVAGLSLSLVSYFSFTRLLDLRLPAGWLRSILP